MDLEMRHLKLVRAVVENGSLTRAGERLHLTQSALSHQLRDLEGRLGTPLFERLGKRLVVTPAGERLLRSARAVEDELERARTDIRRMTAGEAAELRLSTECYTCYHWLPPVLKAFSREYPGVRVSIVAEATRRPLPALLDGKLDVAVVSTPGTDPRLRYERLFRDELVVVMAPDHPLAARRAVRAEDFDGEHLIVYTMPDDENSVLRDVLAPAGAVPREISRIQLTEAIVEMARAGLGVSVLARWAVAPQLEAGTLVARRLTPKGTFREWRAATAPAALPHVRALVRTIRASAIASGI